MWECTRLILAGSCCAGATSVIPRDLQKRVPAGPVPARSRSPPLGDARPGFPGISRSSTVSINEHFGAPLVPDGHLVLLNKVPDNDRMEEIVIGGGIAGSIRDIQKERRWEPIPLPEAYAVFKPTKCVVVVDDSAAPFIRDQKMSVLRPGLVFLTMPSVLVTRYLWSQKAASVSRSAGKSRGRRGAGYVKKGSSSATAGMSLHRSCR